MRKHVAAAVVAALVPDMSCCRLAAKASEAVPRMAKMTAWAVRRLIMVGSWVRCVLRWSEL